MSTENINLLTKLELLGLTDREARIYLIGLAFNHTSIQRLARAIHAKRTTLYKDMEHLIDLGLFSVTIEGKKKRYAVSPPKKLGDFINKQKVLIEEKDELVQSLIPKLQPLFKKPTKVPKLRYLEGREGLWSLADEIVAAHTDIYALGSSRLLFSFIEREEFEKRFIEPRLKQDVKTYFITDHYYPGLRRFYGNLTHGDYRFIAEKMTNPSFLVIFNNTIALINLKSTIFSIVIESKELAEMIQFAFNTIWKVLEGKNLPDSKKIHSQVSAA